MPLTENEFRSLGVGTRVALPDGAEAYPDFMIRDAMTGTITEMHPDHAWVTIDAARPELAEWDNRIQVWFWESGGLSQIIEKA